MLPFEQTVPYHLKARSNALMVWSAVVGVIGIFAFLATLFGLVLPEWNQYNNVLNDSDGYHHGGYAYASAMEMVLIGGYYSILLLCATVSLFATARYLFLFTRHDAPRQLNKAMMAYSVFWVCWALAGLMMLALLLWERKLYHWLEG